MDILDKYDPNGDNEDLDDSDPNKFIAKMGAEAIYQLLQNVGLARKGGYDVTVVETADIAAAKASARRARGALVLSHRPHRRLCD